MTSKLRQHLFSLLCLVGIALATALPQGVSAGDQGFTPDERQAIQNFFRQSAGGSAPEEANRKRKERKGRTDEAKGEAGGGLPPGLSQIDAVPPGVAAQIKRHGTLPAGAPRQSLPGALEGTLPPRAEQRLLVGRDVLLLGNGDLILDILRNAVP